MQKESRNTKREIDTRRSGGRKIRDSRRDGTHTHGGLERKPGQWPGFRTNCGRSVRISLNPGASRG